MDRLDNRIADHALNETMASLREALDGVPDEVERAVADAGREGAVERAAAMLDYLQGLLEAADPRLVAQAALDAVHGHVDQALQAAASLPPDPAGQSANLEQAVENTLESAAPLAAAAAGFAQSTQKIGRKSGAFTKRLKKLEGEAEMMAEELAALESRRRSGLDELVSAEDEKRGELGTRLQQLQEAVAEQQEKVEALAPQLEERFNESEAERGQAFEKVVAGLKERGEESLQRTETVAANVEELYGVVTDTATAGAFSEEARKERQSADRWRRVALGFGTAAAAIAVVAVALTAIVPLSAGTISAKIAATAACLAIAAYAARQSGHHRDRGNEIKDLALELVTFEGVMHGLDDGEQRALRKQFIERAFRGRSRDRESPPADQAIEAFGLTPEVLSVLAALLRAAQSQAR